MSEKNEEILTPTAPVSKSSTSPESELDCSYLNFSKVNMNSHSNQPMVGCGDPCGVSPCNHSAIAESGLQQQHALNTNMVPTYSPYNTTSAGCGEPYVNPIPVKQPITVQFVPVGPNRCRLQCPRCFKDIKTDTKTTLRKSAYLACFLMALCGCLFCACIPCCLQAFKAVHHKCPECHAYIGTYKH